MPTIVSPLAFDDAALAETLVTLSADDVDALDFGVIGFDTAGVVRLCNRYEADAAGLGRTRVVGKPLFTEVAPCMNNDLVGGRFREASVSGRPLDVTIEYVLTLRMRPTRVSLRLVSVPGAAHAYVLVRRFGTS